LLGAAHGPVSVAMPLLTASKLLSSMWFQLSLGLGQYTKNVRVGTYVLVASTLCLIDCGPRDPREQQNVTEMLNANTAKCWLLFLGLALILNLSFYHLLALKPEQQQKYGLAPLCAVVAISTALGASVGKTLSLTTGIQLEIAVCAYLICGAASFLYSAVGAFNYEIELFMPLSEVLQLLVNASTGVLVWGDLSRISERCSYSMVYILICLGIYECMSFDLLERRSNVGIVEFFVVAKKVVGTNRARYILKFVGNKRKTKQTINKILSDDVSDEDLGESFKNTLVKSLSSITSITEREEYLFNLCKQLASISHELYKDLPSDHKAKESVDLMRKQLSTLSDDLPEPSFRSFR